MPAEPGGEQPVRGLAAGDGEAGEARAGPAALPVLQPPPGSVIAERPHRHGPLLVVQLGEQVTRR